MVDLKREMCRIAHDFILSTIQGSSYEISRFDLDKDEGLARHKKTLSDTTKEVAVFLNLIVKRYR